MTITTHIAEAGDSPFSTNDARFWVWVGMRNTGECCKLDVEVLIAAWYKNKINQNEASIMMT